MASRNVTVSPLANTTSSFSLVIGKGHAARIVPVRPWIALIGGTIAAILMGWYLVATLYLVFRDEMLARLMSQQAEMQYAYEDRLAALRNQIDRVTSRQLLDQNSVEGKLHELLSRQAQLETRQAVVASIAEQPIFAGVRNSGGGPTPRMMEPASTSAVQSYAPTATRPTPAADAFELRLVPRGSRATGGPEARPNHSALESAPTALALAAAREAANRLERQQIAALEQLHHTVKGSAQKLSGVFSDAGLDADRFIAGKSSAQGGPLVSIGGKGPFEQKLSELQVALQQADRMRRIVQGLPIARPLPTDYETTSSFGTRSDPFTRGIAMHTGIDFRAPTGTPARATAPGKVVEASYVGGYGNMVEIDHGNGLSTRYAHLSSIGVDVGETVAKGDSIGRVGSTGRSTGPHLHYETRIDGEPADPMRFMRAGQRSGMN